MNTLSVAVNEENGLSFELLVEGQPMGAVLGDGNEGIPYWLAILYLDVASFCPAWCDEYELH